jgi:hypothetical protein
LVTGSIGWYSRSITALKSPNAGICDSSTT